MTAWRCWLLPSGVSFRLSQEPRAFWRNRECPLGKVAYPRNSHREALSSFFFFLPRSHQQQQIVGIEVQRPQSGTFSVSR